jgi:hypothetical protein
LRGKATVAEVVVIWWEMSLESQRMKKKELIGESEVGSWRVQ